MCESCLEGYELTPITPAIKNAVAWLFALYEDHGAAGWLHVWVDDWNLPVPAEKPDWMGPDDNPDEVEQACWDALKVLNEDEQATALAVHDGYYIPEGGSRLRLENGIWDDKQYWSPAVEAAMYRKAYTLNEGGATKLNSGPHIPDEHERHMK